MHMTPQEALEKIKNQTITDNDIFNILQEENNDIFFESLADLIKDLEKPVFIEGLLQSQDTQKLQFVLKVFCCLPAGSQEKWLPILFSDKINFNQKLINFEEDVSRIGFYLNCTGSSSILALYALQNAQQKMSSTDKTQAVSYLLHYYNEADSDFIENNLALIEDILKDKTKNWFCSRVSFLLCRRGLFVLEIIELIDFTYSEWVGDEIDGKEVTAAHLLLDNLEAREILKDEPWRLDYVDLKACPESGACKNISLGWLICDYRLFDIFEKIDHRILKKIDFNTAPEGKDSAAHIFYEEDQNGNGTWYLIEQCPEILTLIDIKTIEDMAPVYDDTDQNREKTLSNSFKYLLLKKGRYYNFPKKLLKEEEEYYSSVSQDIYSKPIKSSIFTGTDYQHNKFYNSVLRKDIYDFWRNIDLIFSVCYESYGHILIHLPLPLVKKIAFHMFEIKYPLFNFIENSVIDSLFGQMWDKKIHYYKEKLSRLAVNEFHYVKGVNNFFYSEKAVDFVVKALKQQGFRFNFFRLNSFEFKQKFMKELSEENDISEQTIKAAYVRAKNNCESVKLIYPKDILKNTLQNNQDNVEDSDRKRKLDFNIIENNNQDGSKRNKMGFFKPIQEEIYFDVANKIPMQCVLYSIKRDLKLNNKTSENIKLLPLSYSDFSNWPVKNKFFQCKEHVIDKLLNKCLNLEIENKIIMPIAFDNGCSKEKTIWHSSLLVFCKTFNGIKAIYIDPLGDTMEFSCYLKNDFVSIIKENYNYSFLETMQIEVFCETYQQNNQSEVLLWQNSLILSEMAPDKFCISEFQKTVENKNLKNNQTCINLRYEMANLLTKDEFFSEKYGKIFITSNLKETATSKVQEPISNNPKFIFN